MLLEPDEGIDRTAPESAATSLKKFFNKRNLIRFS